MNIGISECLSFSRGLPESLVERCRARLPRQSFGVILGPQPFRCTSIEFFQTNVKMAQSQILQRFASYGDEFTGPDRGFWVDPAEQLNVLDTLDRSGLRITAVFHTHRVLNGVPSKIDTDLHFHQNLPMVIVCLAEGRAPETRAYLHGGRAWNLLKIREIDPHDGIDIE